MFESLVFLVVGLFSVPREIPETRTTSNMLKKKMPERNALLARYFICVQERILERKNETTIPTIPTKLTKDKAESAFHLFGKKLFHYIGESNGMVISTGNFGQ